MVNAVLLKVRSAVGIRVKPSMETVSPDLIKKVSEAITVNWAFAAKAAKERAIESIIFLIRFRRGVRRFTII
jgi:hypothetical protein